MPDQDDDRTSGWLTVGRDTDPDDTDDSVTVPLDGTTARTRGGLFTALAEALALPAHFGHNWDALADVLRDRVAVAPLTLRVDDADELLADEPAGQYARFLTVFADVAADAPHPLRVVLRDIPPG
ncbi:barstar family protein [Micromonospora krabiensis]|uniref:Barstar (Barnase inhibitor) n=1 Tax=Micromonospora krabiensis TaxID=307121 RepID=A0A1C3MZW9_9ACTN|nr:barstar family protein [Micromonospora krabiensis]SBV25878.1 Barstar (barnase inhibitor) [Micromonospora krabiensis]